MEPNEELDDEGYSAMSSPLTLSGAGSRRTGLKRKVKRSLLVLRNEGPQLRAQIK